jgi:DNA repair protein RadC
MKQLAIKYWSEDERPREKLIQQGRKNLTNAELLAILIGSGTKDLSALQLARNLLAAVDNNLHTLGKQSIKQLCVCKGIGPAKAVGLIAAFEMGRRRELTEIKKRKKIQSSQEAFQILAPLLKDNYREEFWVVLLNRANEYLRADKLSIGGVSGTVVDAKIVFKLAIDQLASSIILFHNHPSGNLNPSQSDLDITKNLVNAGKVLDIKVIDHLIISENGYFSFADEGHI